MFCARICHRCRGYIYERLDTSEQWLTCPWRHCQRMMHVDHFDFRAMVIHANICDGKPVPCYDCRCDSPPSWPDNSSFYNRRYQIIRSEEQNRHLCTLEPDTRWAYQRGLYKCLICLDDQKTAPELVLNVPCGHASMCIDCAKHYRASTCPLCRAEVKNICNIRLAY